MWCLETIIGLNDAVVRASQQDKTLTEAYSEVGLCFPLPPNTEPKKPSDERTRTKTV